MPLCECCGKAGADLRCGRCRETWYCSAACQKKHWKAGHRTKCVEADEPTKAARAAAAPAPAAAAAAQSGGGASAAAGGEESSSSDTDSSEEMLKVARTKDIYSELHRMTLGETLDFADDSFCAVVCSGVLTPGHAPPSSFTELVRVTRPGAPMVFALRDDARQLPGYHEAVAELEQVGAWSKVFSSRRYQSMPFGEPDVFHRVHVYRKR